jgi:hypothetical protein
MITQQSHTEPAADELPIDNARVIGSRQGRIDSFGSEDTPIDGLSTDNDETGDSHETKTVQDEPTDD